MKSPSKDEVVICRKLAQAGLELTLIDQTTGFIDDNKREYSPGEEMSVMNLAPSYGGRHTSRMDVG